MGKVDYILKYQLKWLNNTIIANDPSAAADAEVDTIDNLTQVKKMNPWYPLPGEPWTWANPGGNSVNRRDWPNIHDIKGQPVNKFTAKACHALIAKTVGISGLERGRPALYHHCGNKEDRDKVALNCFNVVFSTPDCVYDMDTFKTIKLVDIPNWGKLKENCKGWISFQPNQRMESSLVQTHAANYEASSKLKKA